MRPLRSTAIAALAVLSLAACVSPRPVAVREDNPANPNAAPGFVDAPRGLSDYKTSEDFAARASAEESKSSSSMVHMHGMPGMDHGNMPGMHQGGAPQGAESQ